MKRISVLGGGTGAFVVLSGLKKKPVDLAAIVTMADSGGSTGKLRDQLGVLPPGDLRQCLVALSEAPNLWRKLFLYRFKTGDFKGHNFGNIFLSALEKVSKDYNEVLELTSYVLQIRGEVIPVTFRKTDLRCRYENGRELEGEGAIDENWNETSRIVKASLNPKVPPNPRVVSRLKESDFIIIGPGDLYTSIIPIFLVSGVKQAIMQSPAKIIYIMNLMTKGGQTAGYSAAMHLKDLTTYMGREPDIIILNTGKIPADVVRFYSPENQRPVVNGITREVFEGRLIKEDIIDSKIHTKNTADLVNPGVRSILRHDSKKLREVLMKIITTPK